MTRQLRDLDTSEWFHVYNRGHDGQDIFSLDGDRELFETLSGEAARATGVEVHAYALMTNHFHLLVFAPGRVLSDFAKYLCGRYGFAYNQRTNRSGAVFGGRFGSVPISDDDHLLIEARYIERNPLAFMPAGALASYQHSSFGCYLGRRPAPSWLSTSLILADTDVIAYERFVLQALPSDRFPFGALPALDPVEPSLVFDSVTEVIGVDPIAQSGTARNLAAAIALELRVASVSDLAVLLDVSQPAVRQAARRGRIHVDTDPKGQHAHDRIVHRLRRAA